VGEGAEEMDGGEKMWKREWWVGETVGEGNDTVPKIPFKSLGPGPSVTSTQIGAAGSMQWMLCLQTFGSRPAVRRRTS